MADSAVEITAGTGTNVDTRTEGTNGHHRQVIVIGDPATNAGVAPVDATAGLKVDLGSDNDISGTVTANLSATDNAVLDTIDQVLDDIKVDTEAIETALETAGGLVVNLGANNDVTVTGTVDLGATDNAVLDDIAAKLATIDTDTSALAAGVSTEYQVDVVGALPAGTNAIGKLAANSGVDIGDVDVTSIVLPRNLIGPGQPGTAIDSYSHAAINLAAAANQVLVSSAASKQIWVYGIHFVLSAAGTVSFQDEDDTAISGIMPFAANSGLSVPPSGNFSMPIWKLGTDKDLEVDLVTADMDGWIDYAIVSV